MAFAAAAVCLSLTSSAYASTLTQNASVANTLTVDGDIFWAAGTFTGGDAAITGETFSLTGTAAWTSTSVEFKVDLYGYGLSSPGTISFLCSSPNFGHNSGTTTLRGTGHRGDPIYQGMDVSAAIDFHKLKISGGNSDGRPYTYTVTNTATITVEDEIILERDVGGSPGAFYFGSSTHAGTVEVEGDFTSTICHGGFTVLKAVGTGTNTYNDSLLSTPAMFPHLEIAYGVGGELHPAVSTNNMTVSEFTLSSGEFKAPSASASQGFMVYNTGYSTVSPGPVWFTVAGPGTFVHNSGTTIIRGEVYRGDPVYQGIDIAAAINFHKLKFSGGNTDGRPFNHVITNTATITVEDEIILERDCGGSPGAFYLKGGTIEVEGDFTCNLCHGGTTVLKAVGTGTNTYNDSLLSTPAIFPYVEIAYGVGGELHPAVSTNNITVTQFTLTSGEFKAPGSGASQGLLVDLNEYDLAFPGPENFSVPSPGGTFVHNDGTTIIRGWGYRGDPIYQGMNIAAAISFYKLKFNGGNTDNRPFYQTITATATITVVSELVF